MNLEEARLRTFQSWPANAVVEPQRVAKAGFFYTGEGLKVECFSCGGNIYEWDYGDQVMVKHRQLNPECSFVKKPMQSGNVPIINVSSSNSSLTRSDTSLSSPNSLPRFSASDISSNNILNGSLRNSASDCSTNSSGYNSQISSNNLQCSGEQPQNPFLGSLDRSNSQTSSQQSITRDSPSSSQSDNANSRFEIDNSPNNSHNVYMGVRNNSTQNRSEAARLETFRTWPKALIISPERLAKSGFYYIQEGDKVQCAFCSGVVEHWEAGDDPDREHRRHFPSCPLHYNIPVGNIPIGVEANVHSPEGVRQYHAACGNVVLREMRPFSTAEREEGKGNHSKHQPEQPNLVQGIQTHRGPRHPKYSTFESRLRTYTNWPGNLRQTPQKLAEAGFYYTGVHDQVRCFHCDGGLRQWDESDDPWTEHARWFSKCVFVVLMKSEEFIQQVSTQHPPFLPTNAVQDERKLTSGGNQSVSRIRDVTEEELDGLMNTLPVQMAVRVGLDITRIRHAVRQKMEQTGLPYSTSDALIGTVLDMSESPTPGSSHDELVVPQLPNEAEQESFGDVSATRSHEPAAKLQDTNSETIPQLTHMNLSLGNAKKESGDGSVSLEEENRRLKEARLCKICMDEEVGVVFLPCGHLVTCVNCTPSLQDCPLCRQPIKATVRTFLS